MAVKLQFLVFTDSFGFELIRFAFKGDQEIFSRSWTKVRSKNTTIDKKLAGSLVLALIQNFLQSRGCHAG